MRKIARRNLTATIAALAVVAGTASQVQAAPTVPDRGDARGAAQIVAARLGPIAHTTSTGDALTADLTADVTARIPMDAHGVVALAGPAPTTLAVSLPAQAKTHDAVVDNHGAVVYSAESKNDTALVVEPLASGKVSIQTVIPNAGASNRYTYQLQSGVTAVERTDGGLDLVAVDPASGLKVGVGSVDAPWAFDASGAVVPTRYEVSGSTFTQVVQLSKSLTYPVVADPTYGWSYWVIPTAYLNWSESLKAASDPAGVGVICAVVGLWNAPAGVLCAAETWYINSGAKTAVSHGKCVTLMLGAGVGVFERNC